MDGEDTTKVTAGSPERWTTLNIWLHWTILGLLVVQLIDHEWMNGLFDASRGEGTVDGLTTAMGYLHIATGAAIFVAILARLWDRFAHGRPAYPAGEPNWAKALARITHVGLYALLIGMPIAGAFAWFTGNETVPNSHGWAWTVFLVFIGAHVAGALANQFWFKTDVLRRMLLGQGPPA